MIAALLLKLLAEQGLPALIVYLQHLAINNIPITEESIQASRALLHPRPERKEPLPADDEEV